MDGRQRPRRRRTGAAVISTLANDGVAAAADDADAASGGVEREGRFFATASFHYLNASTPRNRSSRRARDPKRESERLDHGAGGKRGGRAWIATATAGWQSRVVAVERTTTTTKRRLLSPGCRQTKERKSEGEGEGQRERDSQAPIRATGRR